MAPSEQVSSDYLGGKALTEEPQDKNHGVSEQNKDVPHKQKGQIQEENKLQKIQTSEAGKKKAKHSNSEKKQQSTLTVTSVAKENQYKKPNLKTDTGF